MQAVVDSILAEIINVNKALVTDLQNDLFVLISKHPFIQVTFILVQINGLFC